MVPAWRVAPSARPAAVASAGVAAGAVVCLITRWATGERRWDGGVAIAVPRGLPLQATALLPRLTCTEAERAKRLSAKTKAQDEEGGI